MESSTDKYEYIPLPSPDAIRVLDLTASSYNPENMMFDVSMRTIDLSDNSHVPFIALSYTWKSTIVEEGQVPRRPSPVHIRCDSKALNIGENLFDCLFQIEQLRHSTNEPPDDVSCLWVDAVCINQDDMDERRSQVAMMQRIYVQSTGVMIWLGRHDKSSIRATSLISMISEISETSSFQNTQYTPDQVWVPRQPNDEEFFSAAGIACFSLSDWGALGRFFSRAWFHRVWTVQEMVMGQSRSRDPAVICGETVFSLQDIGCFIELAFTRGWIAKLKTTESVRTGHSSAGSGLGIDISFSMGVIYEITQDSEIADLLQHTFRFHDEESFVNAKLAWVLNQCRQKKATDERDRVFASSGMITRYRKPDSWHLLAPDYTKTPEQVFMHLATYLLQSLKNLSWLSFVQDRSVQVHQRLPSWVPDLAAPSQPPALILCNSFDVFQNCTDFANGESNSIIFTQVQDVQLRVWGSKLEKLVASYDISSAISNHQFSKLLVAAARAPIYLAGDTWLEAFMKTLTAGSPFPLNFDITETTPSSAVGFDELYPSFIHYLKNEFAQEMWSWNAKHSDATSFWDGHREFGQLCDADNQLPSREDFDDFFSVFSGLYPAGQDAKVNPFIENEDFLRVIYAPTVPYRGRIAVSCSTRSFVRSENAHMGLAPCSVKPEDEIWILQGAKIPFVLRRHHDDSYMLIGEAYIHGIMNGELFEGNNHVEFRSIALT
ncbi:heterokaryon incompatibility protein-domain-containing protein [Pyrenochaeta sp. MPI-SDFR-AT-0127]|nr:heterokaryon incompatibility protein-domain-containing protein [Pyrenochaeta sp. MPI-SDFR-AT-0127]